MKRGGEERGNLYVRCAFLEQMREVKMMDEGNVRVEKGKVNHDPSNSVVCLRRIIGRRPVVNFSRHSDDFTWVHVTGANQHHIRSSADTIMSSLTFN